MKTISVLTLLILVTLLPTPSAGQSQSEPGKYPNELPGFKFHESARWKSLVPLVSTRAEVRKVMGEPREAKNVTRHPKQDLGDALAKERIFTYDFGGAWEIYIYFVDHCSHEGPTLPASLEGRVCSIELLPKRRLSFEKVVFPPAFKKKLVRAFHGEWNEYADGSGLVYEVFTRKTAYGYERPGDLNRIRYGPSDEALRKYASN